PVPFQSPPPSTAVLFCTIQSVKVEFPAPLMWKAPPFPGAVPPMAVLFTKLELVKEIIPAELVSTAPPARTAELPVNVLLETTKTPEEFTKIAPPLPAVAVAVFELNSLSVTVEFATLFKYNAPPPFTPWASLFVNTQLETSKVPAFCATTLPPLALLVKFLKVN